MSSITVSCYSCCKLFSKELKEYNRRVSLYGDKVKFFCSNQCMVNDRKIIPFEETKRCQCGQIFNTITQATYCSRRCASLYSINEARLEVFRNNETHFVYDIAHIIKIANSLRNRESYKYVEIEQYLIDKGIRYQFEFPLTWFDRVFDLCLIDHNTFIEFDERYHLHNVNDDQTKDALANIAGYNVIRLDVRKTPIPFPKELLSSIIG